MERLCRCNVTSALILNELKTCTFFSFSSFNAFRIYDFFCRSIFLPSFQLDSSSYRIHVASAPCRLALSSLIHNQISAVTRVIAPNNSLHALASYADERRNATRNFWRRYFHVFVETAATTECDFARKCFPAIRLSNRWCRR